MRFYLGIMVFWLLLGVGVWAQENPRELTSSATNSTVRSSGQEFLETLRDNNARLRYLTSQVLKIQEQNEAILGALQGDNQTFVRVLEARLDQMSARIEELRIQIQLMAKVILALIGILILLLIYLIFRSRRPPRPGTIRF